MSTNPGGSRSLFAAAADLASPPGPDGPPSSVTEYTYQGGTKYGYQWVNYDSSYYTDYSFDSGSTVEGQLGPGVTSIDTVQQKLNFAVRHASGGFTSSWTNVGEGES